MRIYLYGNSFFKIGNLGKVSGQLKFFQGQTFRNDEKLAIFCIYLKKVKKWTLELQKFAPFTTLHYILLLLNCLAFRLQTFLFDLLFVFLQISWLAFCLIAD